MICVIKGLYGEVGKFLSFGGGKDYSSIIAVAAAPCRLKIIPLCRRYVSETGAASLKTQQVR